MLFPQVKEVSDNAHTVLMSRPTSKEKESVGPDDELRGYERYDTSSFPYLLSFL